MFDSLSQLLSKITQITQIKIFTYILVLLILLLIVGCASVGRDEITPTIAPTVEPTDPPTSEPTTTPTATPAPEIIEPTATEQSTVNSQQPTESEFSLIRSVPYGANVFENGLITGEKEIVGQLFGSAPLYEINITLSDDLQSISGQQVVHYTNQEGVELGEVVFRLYPNIADGATVVSNLQVDGIGVVPSYELENSVMRVPFATPLQPNKAVLISMDFEVTIPIEEGGNYASFILDDEILALAHFYPILSVYDDEGWNLEIPSSSGDSVYSDVGFYVVQITAPEAVTVVASGYMQSDAAPFGCQCRVAIHIAGPVRDFYIVASERFEHLQAQVGETTLNAYAPPEFTEANQRLLDEAVASLELFNERFGVYPYTEFDIASTTTLALGIEYPGVIAMTMRLYDPVDGFPAVVGTSTMAHEVAHQWFYALVGNDQLDEPWLDEALAQYATWVYFRETQGAGGDQGFRDSLVGRWSRVESAEIPIGQPVASFTGSEYGAIVYGRGPLFVDELAQIMGQETFDAFLRDYAAQHRYGIATTDSFKTLAEQHCGCDLTEQFERNVYP